MLQGFATIFIATGEGLVSDGGGVYVPMVVRFVREYSLSIPTIFRYASIGVKLGYISMPSNQVVNFCAQLFNVSCSILLALHSSTNSE